MSLTDNLDFVRDGLHEPVYIYRETSYVDFVDAGEGNDLVMVGYGTGSVVGGAGYDSIGINEYVANGFNPNWPARVYNLEETVTENGQRTVDLATGEVSYAGQTVFGTLYSGSGPTRVDFQSLGAGDYGKLNFTTSGFEAAMGSSRFVNALYGTDRTDIVETFGVTKDIQYFFPIEDDTIDGRGGVDIVSYSGQIEPIKVNLTLQEVTGEDTTGFGETFGKFKDTLVGIEGAYGGNSDDQFTGDSANNYFNGGAGDDIINGGGGYDIATYSIGEFGTVDGGGAHSFTGAANGTLGIEVDLEDGTATDDWGGSDTLTDIEGVVGSVNDDEITGNELRNSLWGGDGDDKIYGEDDVDRIFGDKGDDKLYGGEGRDSLYGGDDSDKLFGDGEDDVLFGDAGNDTVTGGKGDDTLDGGDDDDKLIGSAGEDVLSGGKGDDTLKGGGKRDTLEGGEGDDTLEGGGGADRLEAGKNDDHYNGGGGKTDALSTIGAKKGVKIDLEAGTFKGGGFGNNTIEKIEVIFGTDFKDQIAGDDANERLYGADGKDQIYGGDGKDQLFGGAGSDKIGGGNGDDLLEGDRDPSTSGKAGNGNDRLNGGGGDDTLRGGDGNDKLFGSDGRDILDGGKGNDKLYGGDDADVFVFSKGNDRIKGFDHGNRFDGLNDVIDVSEGDSIARLRNLEDVGSIADDISGNLELTISGHKLTIEGVTFNQLTEANFDFA